MLPAYLDLPSCDETRGRLSELIDGELDAPATARVRLHLAVCPPCARLALELAATVRALHAVGRATGRARQPHS